MSQKLVITITGEFPALARNTELVAELSADARRIRDKVDVNGEVTARITHTRAPRTQVIATPEPEVQPGPSAESASMYDPDPEPAQQTE